MKKLNLFFFFSFSFFIYSSAQTVIDYSFEPTVQHFVVPPGVNAITVTLAGAKGGGALGGKGASFTGICNVIEYHVLSVVAGQRGGIIAGTAIYNGGGGGGASWVYDSNVVLYNPIDKSGLLAVAAGGGGEGILLDPFNDTLYYYRGADGGVDITTNNTTSFLVGADTIGETGGNGGGGSFHAAGGAGWLSNGQGGGCFSGMDEANHFAALITNSYCDTIYKLYPGLLGGFGGGGEGGGYEMAGFDGYNGGGGGGYNGGGAGESDSGGGGGGGGSYLNGTLVGTATASDTGNGFVTISYIPPSSEIIAIYPNPTPAVFTVNGIRQEQLIEIYNCLGQKLQAFQASNTVMQVDLSAYPSGVYIAVVLNADGSKVWQSKVVKIP